VVDDDRVSVVVLPLEWVENNNDDDGRNDEEASAKLIQRVVAAGRG